MRHRGSRSPAHASKAALITGIAFRCVNVGGHSRFRPSTFCEAFDSALFIQRDNSASSRMIPAAPDRSHGHRAPATGLCGSSPAAYADQTLLQATQFCKQIGTLRHSRTRCHQLVGMTRVYLTTPAIGLLAAAYSFFGILPAKYACRPASTPSFIAVAISTESSASAIAVFINTPS
jgi:hypothetical protein